MNKILPIIYIVFNILILNKVCATSRSLDSNVSSYYKIPRDKHHIVKKESKKMRETQVMRMLNLNEDVSLELQDSLTDVKGGFHETYNQLYKGIRVEGSRCLVHYDKNGVAQIVNGNLKAIGNLSVMPSFTQEQCKSIALKAIRSEYSKADNLVQNSKVSIDESLMQCSDGSLVVYVNDDISYLAYEFYTQSLVPSLNKRILIDAHTGRCVKVYNSILSISTYANSVYSNKVQIETSLLNGYYVLRDPSRGNGILTQHANGEYYYSIDNMWNNLTYYDRAAIDAHWALEKCFDFFLNKFGRNSYDNHGSLIKSRLDCKDEDGNDIHNAFWSSNNNCIYFGRSYFGNSYASFDVSAHELTHGVTQYTSGLLYEKESGAINEGISDVFAVCIENEYKPNGLMWTIGEDVVLYGIRNLAYPNCKYYHGDGWVDTNQIPTLNNDYCGVHTNSGVFSYWFYLLANGGNGFNEVGDYYNVIGIGLDKAIQICYLMNTAYLTPNSGYKDAFICSKLAAQALGYGDDIVSQIINAWYAVGVFTSIDVTGSLVVCDSETYTVSGSPSTTAVHWSTTNANLQLVAGQGDKTAEFQKMGDGECGIVAQIHMGSLIISDTLMVWCGVPSQPQILSWPNKLNPNSVYGVTALQSSEQGVNQYQWTLQGGTIVGPSTGPSVMFRTSRPGTDVVLTVRAKNDCGWGNVSSKAGRVKDGSSVVTSTGSGKTINITMPEPGSYEIQLWSKSGLLRKETTDLQQYTININTLPSDIYFVRVLKDGEVVQQSKFLK